MESITVHPQCSVIQFIVTASLAQSPNPALFSIKIKLAWPWMCLVCLPMSVTSLVSGFCVPFSFGLPPAPIMGPPVPKEAPVVYQASCSCWVNSVLA